MTVILFWKPDHAGALGIQTFSKIAHQQRFRNVAFAAVAQGTLKAVANFPLNRQLGNIPFLIDIHISLLPGRSCQRS